jgi:hypothetical protein
MPSKRNRNAARHSAHSPANCSPLLPEIDSTWSPQQSPLLELDKPPDTGIQIHLELPPIASEDESPPVKHEGGLLLATPESRPSPVQQEVNLPHTEHIHNFASQLGALGHTRSPVLARCVLFLCLSLAGASGAPQFFRTLSCLRPRAS